MDSSRRRNSARAPRPRSVKPSLKARRKPGRPQGSRIGPTLEAVRHQIAICAALAYVTSAALKVEGSDCAAEAAVVLRRAIGDELYRQIKDIDWLLAHGRGI
jgi:hypothetical protein